MELYLYSTERKISVNLELYTHKDIFQKCRKNKDFPDKNQENSLPTNLQEKLKQIL